MSHCPGPARGPGVRQADNLPGLHRPLSRGSPHSSSGPPPNAEHSMIDYIPLPLSRPCHILRSLTATVTNQRCDVDERQIWNI